MQTDKIKSLYLKFRASGEYALRALYAAKILVKWEEMESAGLVRLKAEPEQENYFDVYGEPDTDKERKEMESILEMYGCWLVRAEYFNGEKWERADSVGMNTGYKNPLSPFENCYVPQLMDSAMEAVEKLEPEYVI